MAAGSALESLRARVRAIEGGGIDVGRMVARLGGPLDAALPWGGLPYRALHEVTGSVATGCVAGLAARALRRGGALLWCTSRPLARRLGEPYGPGLARFGIGPDRLWLVQARDERGALWAFEAALRTPGVACVVAELERLDLKASRRLQLAAEAGGGMGLVLRPSLPDTAPSAALTRWRAEPVTIGARGAWRLAGWRIRGAAPWQGTVVWHDETLSFALAAALGHRADAARRPPPHLGTPAGSGAHRDAA